MSNGQVAKWLVVYDIADPRRLARVFRRLGKAGIPIQYSVFAVDSSAAKLSVLMSEIDGLIHKTEDDVRAYRLPENAWEMSLGAAILPEGTLLRA